MRRLVIAGLDNIAQETGCSRKTLYKWIKKKEFPAFKMDGVWRALPGEIEQWVRWQRDAARQAEGEDLAGLGLERFRAKKTGAGDMGAA